MYRAGEVSVHPACCERATQPYSLGGGGTIYPGSRPSDVTTRSPRMVAVCLLKYKCLLKHKILLRVCFLLGWGGVDLTFLPNLPIGSAGN